ncbi:succinate-semialdehyde dehydrogenase/glutarate-semialdehyde dehydrogenase [Tamaricihabitans halophyticus]|uniref:Succinate-semialdehyde dehydrogenase/glutarate-semialdehyde dehydrogenase n=1 Tax=Tamaricihabitans halophyticus TaxID=1262583 RepID=A0A4V2STF4_9PSEU|nr:aldehyde dehydrogenase family protein [Tamaricihabitans halophyticus]TCP49926.1 succinate-semialdehyde dehydrogenase/glutarate-semialdehyde dehydrogenase [Tamaricihabitans halophyticus]
MTVTAHTRYESGLPPLGNLVDGQWRLAGEGFDVRNKYTDELIAELPEAPAETVTEAVRVLDRAARAELLTPADRATVLRRTAELLEERREAFATLMIDEVGFTRSDVDGEIDRAVVTLGLCAEEATRLTGRTASFASSPGQHHRLGFTVRVPLGVVCAITPFNSPLNTVLHKIGPALAGGNAVVLKPSGQTPLTAALLCATLLDAGLPPSLLALLHGVDARVGELLLAEPDIAFYSFTGSTKVGRAIQRGAGLRRTQLELGSIASTIVCADADLDRAVPRIANAGFRKAGQVCTSVQRLYVARSIVDEVTERMVTAATAMPSGDPRDPSVRVGPMISESAATRVSDWLAEARHGGAQVRCGGGRNQSVVEPTVLVEAQSGMRVVDQEVFGPVLTILPFDELTEAIDGANDTPFGLAAGIFTQDIDQALRAARSLRFGTVHLNEPSSSRADSMPFGGVKESGHGHEGPAYAIREVTEERLVTLNPADPG